MFTTDDKRDKEQFYLQSVVHKAPKSNLIGKHTLQEETNRNGETVCEISFCK